MGNIVHKFALEQAINKIHFRKILKKLLNEVEHDIENYQLDRLCVKRGLHNFLYYAKTESYNCFVQNQETKNNTNGTHVHFMPS